MSTEHLHRNMEADTSQIATRAGLEVVELMQRTFADVLAKSTQKTIGERENEALSALSQIAAIGVVQMIGQMSAIHPAAQPVQLWTACLR